MEGMVSTIPAERVNRPDIRRVLVTGAEGYIGSVLISRLTAAGYEVDGLDTGYYRSGWLYHDGADRPRIATRDTRTIKADDLLGYGAVVHLAELSNDPTCELSEEECSSTV